MSEDHQMHHTKRKNKISGKNGYSHTRLISVFQNGKTDKTSLILRPFFSYEKYKEHKIVFSVF